MTRTEAVANLIAVIRRYLDRMPLFVRERIEAAIREVEEANG